MSGCSQPGGRAPQPSILTVQRADDPLQDVVERVDVESDGDTHDHRQQSRRVAQPQAGPLGGIRRDVFAIHVVDEIRGRSVDRGAGINVRCTSTFYYF